MNKYTLLYYADEHSNLNANFLERLWKQNFNLEPVDESKTYDSTSSALVVNHLLYSNKHRAWMDRGHKVIIDHLWDNDVFAVSTVNQNLLTLKAPNWIWFNEALWYISLGYDKFTHESSADKFFLMLMNFKKEHRTLIFDKMSDYLNDSLYSYLGMGISIQGDINRDQCPYWNRYTNPTWYSSTFFNLVVETGLNTRTFISEKTFKPIAFCQPFVVWGSPNTLTYLHSQGFETFGHVIDESYDTMLDPATRIDAVATVIDRLYIEYIQRRNIFDDVQTKEKLMHNHNHFYNPVLINTMFNNEVITPIMEFFEQ